MIQSCGILLNLLKGSPWSLVSDRPSEPIMDIIALFRGHRSLPRPTQLPLHSMLSETLSLAAAERLRLPQLPKGEHLHTHSLLLCWV